MNYEHLKACLKEDLPLNRKERFYTGTVLPSILFHNGLSNLFRFLKEIEGFPEEINEFNTGHNFLFYTEYNLKESAGNKSIGAEIQTDRGDTPDVVIEIIKPQKVFVIIEAKMFSSLSQNDFGRQIAAQKKSFSDPLRNTYDDAEFLHVGLTPEKLKFQSTNDYQIINWEFLLSDAMSLNQNYFADFLRLAIEKYDDLVSNKSWVPSTSQDKHSGSDIYQNGKTDNTMWIGRDGGIPSIESDVKNGTWKKKLYFTNSEKPAAGREGNWISSREFMETIDRITEES